MFCNRVSFMCQTRWRWSLSNANIKSQAIAGISAGLLVLYEYRWIFDHTIENRLSVCIARFTLSVFTEYLIYSTSSLSLSLSLSLFESKRAERERLRESPMRPNHARSVLHWEERRQLQPLLKHLVLGGRALLHPPHPILRTQKASNGCIYGPATTPGWPGWCCEVSPGGGRGIWRRR